MGELKISSPSFEKDGWIPNQYSGYGEDLSPEIIIENLSKDTVSMVITLDDLDHPIIPGYNHWVAWNIKPSSLIPEGLPKGEIIEEPIHIEQGIAYGKHCYHGPKPPFNWQHRYLFTIYTLDTILTLPTSSKKEDVLKAMESHIIQSGQFQGIYRRKRK